MRDIKQARIAFLSCGCGHVRRGIETSIVNIAGALREKGLNIVLYRGGGKAKDGQEKLIPCLKRSSALNQWLVAKSPGFLWRAGLGSTYALESLTFAWNILPELVLKRYDLIYLKDPYIAEFLRKWIKAGLIRSRLILSHGTEEPPEFLQKFDYLQHQAPYHLQELQDQLGMRKDGWFAIGNFVDTERFRPGLSTKIRQEYGIPDSAFVVLSVAAIKRHHKRIDHLIKEVSLINRPDVYLLAAGAEVDQTDEVIEFGRKTLGNRVVFLKDFPPERMPGVYAAADLFVLGSLKDMMPNALLEALASGLPAVVHHYPVQEWMAGAGGESIDMSVDGELAAAIVRYFLKPFYKEKSRAAREQAEKEFGKDVIVGRIIQMFEKVVG